MIMWDTLSPSKFFLWGSWGVRGRAPHPPLSPFGTAHDCSKAKLQHLHQFSVLLERPFPTTVKIYLNVSNKLHILKVVYKKFVW